MHDITSKVRAAGDQPGAAPHFFLALLLAASFGILQPPMPLLAQGLDAEGAREAIIDAPVETEQKTVADENDRIAKAIASSEANATQIRKLFNIGKVDIVLVEGLADDDSPLAAAIDGNSEAIAGLRREIEGSAIFYHAIDSQQILLKDIVAVEFGEEDDVTIFVAAPVAG